MPNGNENVIAGKNPKRFSIWGRGLRLNRILLRYRLFQFWNQDVRFYLAGISQSQKKMAQDLLRSCSKTENHNFFVVTRNSKVKCVMLGYFPKEESLVSLLGVFVVQESLSADWRALRFAMDQFVQTLAARFENEKSPILYWLVPKSENEKWIYGLQKKTQLRGYLTHIAESFDRRARVLFDFEFAERGEHASQIPTRWHGSLRRLCSIPIENLLYKFEYLAAKEKVKEEINLKDRGDFKFEALPQGVTLW